MADFELPETRDKTDRSIPINSFEDMGLRPELLQGLQDLGFTKPSAHQAKAVPICMAENDTVTVAVAGTGKTVAVVISLLNNLDLSVPTCQIIHLTPYRECSTWTVENYQTIGRHVNFTSRACFGGTAIRQDIEAVKSGVQILVSTPGRLLGLLNRKILDITNLKTVVVDEMHDIVDYKNMSEQILEVFEQFTRKPKVIVVYSHASKETKSVTANITTDPVYVDTK